MKVKTDEKITPSEEQELPETPRIEQLRMLLDEYIFAVIAFLDRGYTFIAKLAQRGFDKLPIADNKRDSWRKLLKKLALIFSVIFVIFTIFEWLNPLLGFLVIIAMAMAIFYWPDLAFRFREYQQHKKQ